MEKQKCGDIRYSQNQACTVFSSKATTVKLASLRYNSISSRKRIKFNKEATRWLRIWLDSQLKFTAYINKRLTKAKSVKIQIKHLSATYGLALGLIRQIQITAVQFFALYGAKLWWKRQKNHEYKAQQLINRQARAITGIYPSMPIQALISESGLVPARILLDHRQRMYTYRLLRLPDDHPTKNILPISFRNRDGDTTQEDVQPRDTLAWTQNEKPISLGQWLAWQTSMANVVDPAYGVEPIKRSWQLNTNTYI